MNKVEVIHGSSYKSTLEGIKKRVHEAKYMAFQRANTELIKMYWDIGKIIYEKQKEEGWGNSVVILLALDLQREFESIKGFSRANIFNIRKFYITYKDYSKVQQLVGLLGWSHNIMIMQKCKDGLEREYYIRCTIRNGWSRAVLKERIKTKDYERWAISQSNFDKVLPIEFAQKSNMLIKDEYNLGFLGLKDNVKEKDLEEGIMNHIMLFLQEMGVEMMFVGRQFRLNFEGEQYFIDLLFYHKKLRSYVIIELKVGKFKSEYAGKMSIYLSAIENSIRDVKYDNPTIGIILCESKNRGLVDTTLKFITKPVGVSTYQILNKRQELPEDMQKYLPTKKQIFKRLMLLSKE